MCFSHFSFGLLHLPESYHSPEDEAPCGEDGVSDDFDAVVRFEFESRLIKTLAQRLVPKFQREEIIDFRRRHQLGLDQ